jgi:hypothetical protein
MMLSLLFVLAAQVPPHEDAPALIRKGIDTLVTLQEDNGAWSYEGVYRVKGEIPVPYKVGGTATVAVALLSAAPDEGPVKQAIDRGLSYILKHLGDPMMEPSVEDQYDVRIWGQASALEFLCRVRGGRPTKGIDGWIEKLVRTIAIEEIPGGGWNYARHDQPASFVTAPVVQSLLWAKAQGFELPKDILDRSKKSLEAARADDGAFLYSGNFKEGQARKSPDFLAGSAARSAACEATLRMLGGGSEDAVQSALDAFHDNWAHLEQRAKKTGTHEGAFKIAPYYFYYGHRYAGQAIRLLPEPARAKEMDRLRELLLKTRENDGSWNDRHFERSRAYGTAMALLALLGERDMLPGLPLR